MVWCYHSRFPNTFFILSSLYSFSFSMWIFGTGTLTLLFWRNLGVHSALGLFDERASRDSFAPTLDYAGPCLTRAEWRAVWAALLKAERGKGLRYGTGLGFPSVAASIYPLIIFLESRFYRLPPFAIPPLCANSWFKRKIMLRAWNRAAYKRNGLCSECTDARILVYQATRLCWASQLLADMASICFI